VCADNVAFLLCDLCVFYGVVKMNSKLVSVYSVSCQHISMPESAIHFEAMKFAPRFSLRDFDAMPDFAQKVCVERWPVVEFRNAADGEWPFRDQPEFPPIFKSTYVAVDPELERLISIKYKREIDAAKSKALEEIRKRENMQSSINKFLMLPWYVRVWQSVFTKNLELAK
jgi:hypothetical protein